MPANGRILAPHRVRRVFQGPSVLLQGLHPARAAIPDTISQARDLLHASRVILGRLQRPENPSAHLVQPTQLIPPQPRQPARYVPQEQKVQLRGVPSAHLAAQGNTQALRAPHVSFAIQARIARAQAPQLVSLAVLEQAQRLQGRAAAVLVLWGNFLNLEG